MKTIVTKNLKESSIENVTFGCSIEKKLGKVVYEFTNACDQLVFGIYDAFIKYGKDNNRYLVLSGKFSSFEFLFSEDSILEFAELNPDAKTIGVNCQIADDYSIAISNALARDYEISYHNL